MKKTIAILLTTVLIIGCMTALAAGPARRNASRFVDENGDGICDNRASCTGFVDEDNDGICDNCQRLRRFVDKNNDGVCGNGRSCRGRGRNTRR